MTGFTEIVVVAFVTQLAVLPGEKVQLLIAGLSTRYHPLLVVSAAGTAFAGWTVLEIAFGQAVQGSLPAAALDGITAVLFFLFAALLVRSAPAPGAEPVGTDGGISAIGEVELPLVGGVSGRTGTFLSIFALMATGEFGDKTQVVTIALALQYGASPGIWVGEMLAIIPVSLANAYFFHRFSRTFDLRKAHIGGAALFVFFALDVVLQLLVGFSVWEQVVGVLGSALA